MTAAPHALGPLGRLYGALTASRRRPALAWGAATLALLLSLGGGPGVSRDEAAVLAAARVVPQAPAAAAARPVPPLAAEAAWTGHALLAPLGVPRLRAARAGSAALGALLSAALALLAFDVAGPAAALLAPALFWAAPRHLHAGLVATPELALAALTLLTVLGYRRAAADPDPRRRRGAGVRAGLLFGAALLARPDAWVLLPALAVDAAVARATGAAALAPGGRLRGPSAALVAMALLGPAVALATWPAVWSPARLLAALAPGGAAPAWHHAAAALRGAGGPARPLLLTALTVPAAIGLAWAGGLAHAAWRLARAASGRLAARNIRDDLLLLSCAAFPLAAAAAGLPAPAGGVRPWLHALPFLALLGARGLLAAARAAWPERAAPLAASLALLALWPGLRATAHAWPSGGAAWSELAGGAPGAASLGLERQEPGEAAAALAPLVNARAPEGARIWWPTVAPGALAALALDGRLRRDLAVAAGPEDADLAVVTIDAAGRDAEYRAWSAFRTAAPVAGSYLDEVPLGLVYARPGAWR